MQDQECQHVKKMREQKVLQQNKPAQGCVNKDWRICAEQKLLKLSIYFIALHLTSFVLKSEVK